MEKDLFYYVDEAPVIDWEQLEETYGSDFKQKIEDDIEFCKEENLNWKLDCLGGHVIDLLFFATSHFTTIYDVSKNNKNVLNEYTITPHSCIHALNLMKDM